MNCDEFAERTDRYVAGTLSGNEIAQWCAHADSCRECREARHGAEALRLLKARDAGRPDDELFRNLSASLDGLPRGRRLRSRFWLGSAFGGAVAASLFAVLLASGWITPPAAPTPGEDVFHVALAERRDMHIAIEAREALQGAKISILLAGGIELDGYPGQRELEWTTDLDAGVNHLALPVIAEKLAGGRMVVRLSHPKSEQVFVIRVVADA